MVTYVPGQAYFRQALAKAHKPVRVFQGCARDGNDTGSLSYSDSSHNLSILKKSRFSKGWFSGLKIALELVDPAIINSGDYIWTHKDVPFSRELHLSPYRAPGGSQNCLAILFQVIFSDSVGPFTRFSSSLRSKCPAMASIML